MKNNKNQNTGKKQPVSKTKQQPKKPTKKVEPKVTPKKVSPKKKTAKKPAANKKNNENRSNKQFDVVYDNGKKGTTTLSLTEKEFSTRNDPGNVIPVYDSVAHTVSEVDVSDIYEDENPSFFKRLWISLVGHVKFMFNR